MPKFRLIASFALFGLVLAVGGPVRAADPAGNDCGRKFSALVPFENPQPLPLPPMEEMFEAAGLGGQLDHFRAHAGHVETIYEYAGVHRSIGSGYMLAPDRFRGVSEFYPARGGIAHWSEGYREHRLLTYGPNHTANYLEAITATGKPIIFLVPPNVLTKQGITRDEMLWFLAHPEKMKNVRFVFGAYDVFSEELTARLLFARDLNKMLQLLGPPESRPSVY